MSRKRVVRDQSTDDLFAAPKPVEAEPRWRHWWRERSVSPAEMSFYGRPATAAEVEAARLGIARVMREHAEREAELKASREAPFVSAALSDAAVSDLYDFGRKVRAACGSLNGPSEPGGGRWLKL